jgi:hypothetical protein
VAIHRRQFIGGILACGCGTPFAAAEEQSRFRVGCYAGDGEQGASKYKASTGVSAYDSTVRSALDSVGRVMGRPVGAKLAFIEENNAHFNPPASLIAFGKLLLDGLQGPDFALKVTCIAAHEVAHIIQFEDGYFDVALSDATVRRNELMADHFAGCCLAFIVSGGRRIDRGKIYRNKPSVQSAFQLMASRGDFNFTNPNHHGTPSERLEAFDGGYEAAFEVGGGNPTGDIGKQMMDNARFGLR